MNVIKFNVVCVTVAYSFHSFRKEYLYLCKGQNVGGLIIGWRSLSKQETCNINVWKHMCREVRKIQYTTWR